ncbi:MAG: hypothetical protein EB092_07240 [Chitinophagia bacterium]|nr:hypothetical protein [Chitinophagia bacterium]
MLNKIRVHQIFFMAFGLLLIFFDKQNAFFKISDVSSSLAIVFLIIMSFGVSHGASDSIVIWDTFSKLKAKALAFFTYLFIVFLGLFLWFQSPALGLIILLLMSIFHFGESDLAYLKKASRSIKLSWGFAMTLLPIIFFERDVKAIFDLLVNFDISLKIFFVLKILTLFFICNFLFLVYISNIFLTIFTLPVTFFAYFVLYKNLQIEYLNTIFSILMALTISHMLLPLINRSVLNFFAKR